MNTPDFSRHKDKMKQFNKNGNSAGRLKRSSSHNMSDSFLNKQTPGTSQPTTPQLSAKTKGKHSDLSFPPLGNTPTRHQNTQLLKPQFMKNTPEYIKPMHETPKHGQNLVGTPQSQQKVSATGKISKLEVAVRIRPMTVRELNIAGCTNIVNIKDNNLVIQIYSNNDPTNETSHCFHYDHILWSCDPDDQETYTNQETVYTKIAKPLVDETFQGYNACLFAYGQTGSGKSYSMMGNNNLEGITCDLSPDAGITPRFCKDLFDRIQNFDPTYNINVEVSYFEIYNEKIHDLLLGNSVGDRQALRVREHPVWGPYVVDLSVHPVNSFEALYSWILAGNKVRTTASTIMNDQSSRSHSIFTVVLSISAPTPGKNDVAVQNNMGNSRRSKISFVDLAGSERVGSMSSNNEERLRQGVCINRSLLALGKVIAALSDLKRQTNHIPYRESVLTWLLRESLGGNSRTCMLATITPASCHLEETLSTLRYASQARNIVNRVRINEDPNDRLIRELRAEVEALRALRQEYHRQSLTKSPTSFNNTSIVEENTTLKEDREVIEPEDETECVVENVNGRLHVKLIQNENVTILEDNLYLRNGDKLVISGGSNINVEKRELDTDSEDEPEETVNETLDISRHLNDENNQNLPNIDDLNTSIAAIERYCNVLEANTKICSTPDSPNDISQFRSNTNFLEELESILTNSSPATKSNFYVNSPIRAIFNNSLTSSQKKSARKKDKDSVFKYIVQLQDSSQCVSRFAHDNEEILKALDMLNEAIQNVGYAFRTSRKTHKSVTFND